VYKSTQITIVSSDPVSSPATRSTGRLVTYFVYYFIPRTLRNSSSCIHIVYTARTALRRRIATLRVALQPWPRRNDDGRKFQWNAQKFILFVFGVGERRIRHKGVSSRIRFALYTSACIVKVQRHAKKKTIEYKARACKLNFALKLFSHYFVHTKNVYAFIHVYKLYFLGYSFCSHPPPGFI